MRGKGEQCDSEITSTCLDGPWLANSEILGPVLKTKDKPRWVKKHLPSFEEAPPVSSASGAAAPELFKTNLCSCKRQCKQHLKLTMVLAICQAFWSLTKAAQDCVPWGFKFRA